MANTQCASTPDRERSSARRARRRGWLALALPLAALLALVLVPAVALAGGGGGGGPTPGIALSPSSGRVGTHVSASGNNFHAGDDISIGYSTGNCGSGVVTISGGRGQARGEGKVPIFFTCPADTPAGKYTVCVIDNPSHKTYPASSQFEVLSPNPPTITVNGPVTAGDKVTVTGANFLPGGGTVDISYGPSGSNGCATSAGSATVGADGSFSASFNAPFTSSDETITVTAVEPQSSCGQSPVLEAHAHLSVKAQATPTPIITSTPNPSPNPPLPWPPTWPPTRAWTGVDCLV